MKAIGSSVQFVTLLAEGQFQVTFHDPSFAESLTFLSTSVQQFTVVLTFMAVLEPGIEFPSL